MPEFTNEGGILGRSIHDAPDLSASEREELRVERIMERVTKHDLERALIALLGAVREAEGQAIYLQNKLYGLLSPALEQPLDQITESLIADGIDEVGSILPEGALEILEAQA
jgi:hypothetical protein